MNADHSTQATAAIRSALCRMARKYPYHAEWLSLDQWQEEPGVATMAVTVRGDRVRFYYNPTFVCDCTPEEHEAVIHHELNHVVFRHPFAKPKDYPNRHARLIAEEVTVNEHVPERLPGNPLRIDEYPELPPGEDTHTRYQRLAARTDLADKVRLLDQHCLWHDRPFDENDWESDMMSVHRAIADGGHGGRPDGKEKDPLRLACSLFWGRRPGRGVIESLRSASEPIQPLDWKRILNGMAGVYVDRQATFHRPPRRLPQLVGVFPGCTCRTRKPRAMAAIDTSSSMTKRHFERVSAELNRIRELADVTVVQCDKVIQKTHPLNGELQEITGRGGTDLRPPFAREVIKEVRPALIIYFTDGDGPAPQRAPNIPVIWCLTPAARRPADWGRVVHMQA